jgi:hypothetical protein
MFHRTPINIRKPDTMKIILLPMICDKIVLPTDDIAAMINGIPVKAVAAM